MTLRDSIRPYSLGMGLIAIGYLLAVLIGGDFGIACLLVPLVGFPVIVGAFERDRNPGKWIAAAAVAALVSLAILAATLFYAVSQI